MGGSNRNEREYTSGSSSRTRQDDAGNASSSAGEVGRDFANRYGGLFSEKDWKCPICSNINWARRIECNQCKTPKPGSETTMGSREGRGGGFMERDEVVEYRKSRDAEKDDEYDEFGRRRKKTRDFGSNNGGSKDNQVSYRDKTNENNIDAEDEDDEDDDRWAAWNDIIGNDESSNEKENGRDNKSKRLSRDLRSDNQSRRRSSRSLSPYYHDRSRRSRSISQDRGRYRSRSRSRDRDRERDRDRDRRRSYRSRSRSLSRNRKRSSYRSRSRSTSRNRRKRSTYRSRSISKSRSRERRR